MKRYLGILSMFFLTLLAGCAVPPAPPSPEFEANDEAQQQLVNVLLSTENGSMIITFDPNAMPVALTINNPSPQVQTLRLQDGQAFITATLPDDAPIAPGQTVNITLTPVSTTLNSDGTVDIRFQGTVTEFPQISFFTLTISGTTDGGTPPTLTDNPTVTLTATINTLFGPFEFVVFSVPAQELLQNQGPSQ